MTLFTLQERRVVFFLIGTLTLGYGIRLYNQSHFYDEFNPVSDEEKTSFMNAAEIAYASSNKSTEVTSKIAEDVAVEKNYKPKTENININTAKKQELIKLPKIGPVTAKRIIKFRDDFGPFNTFDGLLKVKGIGPKTLEKLKPLITL